MQVSHVDLRNAEDRSIADEGAWMALLNEVDVIGVRLQSRSI